MKPFCLSSETVPPIKPFYLSNATRTATSGYNPVKLLRISAAEFSYRISTSGMTGAKLEAVEAARAREAMYADRARRGLYKLANPVAPHSLTPPGLFSPGIYDVT